MDQTNRPQLIDAAGHNLTPRPLIPGKGDIVASSGGDGNLSMARNVRNMLASGAGMGMEHEEEEDEDAGSQGEERSRARGTHRGQKGKLHMTARVSTC